jgi:hypothetical protein
LKTIKCLLVAAHYWSRTFEATRLLVHHGICNASTHEWVELLRRLLLLLRRSVLIDINSHVHPCEHICLLRKLLLLLLLLLLYWKSLIVWSLHMRLHLLHSSKEVSLESWHGLLHHVLDIHPLVRQGVKSGILVGLVAHRSIEIVLILGCSVLELRILVVHAH